MGKLITFISLIIFIDLFLLATGQLCTAETCSISSIVFKAIVNINTLPLGEFVKFLIGDIIDFASSKAGFYSLAVLGGVTLGALVTKSDTVLFIPLAATMALMGSDLILIFDNLGAQSFITAMFVMLPVSVIFYIVVVDWLRGKD